jgi:hypothetical protein
MLVVTVHFHQRPRGSILRADGGADDVLRSEPDRCSSTCADVRTASGVFMKCMGTGVCRSPGQRHFREFDEQTRGWVGRNRSNAGFGMLAGASRWCRVPVPLSIRMVVLAALELVGDATGNGVSHRDLRDLQASDGSDRRAACR